MTGLSRAQVTRLIASYADTGHVKAAPYQRRKFGARYTKADVDLLAYVDKSHGNLSGPGADDYNMFAAMHRHFGNGMTVGFRHRFAQQRAGLIPASSAATYQDFSSQRGSTSSAATNWRISIAVPVGGAIFFSSASSTTT
jgi:hypothetical protein